MRNIFLLISLFFVFINSSVSQEILILNETDLSPIENVAIFTPDMSTSALTDKDGIADISIFKSENYIYFQHPSFKYKTLSYFDLEALKFTLKLHERTIKLSEIIVAANKWEQESSEIPNKLISISAKSIQFANPQTSADLLGSTGEVFIQKSQLGGGSPMIRGFSANRLLIMVDGVRMNNAIFRSGNLQNIILVDPNALESSEIIFGPGTVLYGSDALGGVMDFHSRKILLPNDTSTILKASGMFRYSTANKERTTSFSLNYGKKKWGFATVISHSTFDDLRTGSVRSDEYNNWGQRPEYVETNNNIDTVISNSNENIQKFSGYSQTNLLQKFIYKPNDNLFLKYTFMYSESSNIPRYDRLIEYSDDILKYAVWEYGPQKWNMHSLQINSSKENKYYDNLSLTLSLQDIEESRIDRKIYATNLRTRTENVLASSVNLDLVKVISNNQSLYYGFEGTHNRVNSEGYSEDILSGLKEATPSRYPDGGTNYFSSAFYLSYKNNITEKLIFQTGARYNYFILNSVFDTNIYEFPFSEININSGAFNGSAGVVYTPKNDIRINSNISSGYRAPNLDDIGKVFDSEPGNVIIPNENLQAEHAYNLDLGITKYFGAKAVINVTGFYTYLNNAMVRRDADLNGADSIMYDEELSNVQSIVNTGYANIYGLSAQVIFDITNNFSFKSNLTFTDGQDDEDLPLRHTPPLFGSSTLTFIGKRFKSEFYVNYNAKKAWEDLTPGEQSKTHLYTADGTPAWMTLNLKSSFQINKFLQLNVGIENILDVHYRPYSSGISAPGRNLIFTLRGNF